MCVCGCVSTTVHCTCNAPLKTCNTMCALSALRLLRAKGMNGTYLIRAGSHAGAEKVLSVWHKDRCRHFKLFKDEVS